ncbi:histone-lysine N-methyltransferase eggless isoform X1 [Anastrepha obliqua]|uniref:histone-lysine N-methyltransferase eggless isoform X1 n=1 Tax=Anastrepha obliqua TaxID=95512 RepID=UPI00240A31CC|nr:histone-lysine N-methyltransferase eggless isoform X1 [Anastrepha obliqua]
MSDNIETNAKDTSTAGTISSKKAQDIINVEKNGEGVNTHVEEAEIINENIGEKISCISDAMETANENTLVEVIETIDGNAGEMTRSTPEGVNSNPEEMHYEDVSEVTEEPNTASNKENKQPNRSINMEVENEATEHIANPSPYIGASNLPNCSEEEIDAPLTELSLPKEIVSDSPVEPMETDKDILTKSGSTDAKSTDLFEGNDDSQESLPLVIDEKPIETPTKSCQIKNSEDDEKDHKGTANDAIEIPSETQIESSHQAVKNCESTLENVIEIDDDIEETKPQEEDLDVEITETRSASYIPVIEIDDDDDEEPQGSNVVQKNELNGEKGDPSTTLETSPTVAENISDRIVPEERANETKEDTQMEDASTEKLELLTETAMQPENEKQTISDADESALKDTSDEIFYNQECINHDCPHNHKQFFLAPQFALSHFKVKKRRTQKQYVCTECYDSALDVYEDYCSILKTKQPLLLKNITVQGPEFVEITDSSEDEEEAHTTTQTPITKSSFSKVDLDLIKAELESSIKNVLENLEIQNQLTWSKTILTTRARRLEEESNLNDELLRSLQRKADQMYSSLYQCPKIRLRQFQPLDLNTGLPYTFPEVTPCPPTGEIMRPSIEINQIYYAVKNKAIASWVPCKVVEQVEPSVVIGAHSKVPHYKVKFMKLQYQMVKTVSAKHIAYYDPPKFRLPIGSRVIAYFDATSLSRGKEKMMIQSAFYPGIIAEPLKPNNNYRYLIFYDDGYTQYVSHKDVRLVCNVSEHVWEDVHPASREFIQKYLTQYSINRPMVQTQKGQSMTTESNGKWIYARVVDIDCSLIQMQFEGPKSHTEWIYRGSLRLGPVFKEYQKTLQKDTLPIPRLARRTEPFIRYTADEEATTAQHQQQQQQAQERERASSTEPRAVAKKSVSRLSSDPTSSITNTQSATPSVPTVRHLNNSTIYLEDENKPKGKVVYYTAKRDLPPLTYRPHKCSSSCLFKIPHNLSAYSPLSKPLLSGWERPILRLKNKKIVAYRGPCGKIMRNMEEVRRYLRATNNILNVDNFDFHHETSCLAEYVIESAIVQKRDISGGQERMAIPLVNYYDNTLPPECKYAAQRIPTDGVNINLDPEFLVGCDCEGDCSDKEKCSCWQLTYAGAKYGNPNTPMEEIGYQYKRLYEHVPTGIYECNSRCKCKSNCLNRVAQQPLAMKLQVFKTSNRGWGLRCINDVPRGSFVCIYAGHLLTEAKANEGGLDAGDEYFAELDYIEVAEQIKEGYESDVEPPEVEEEEDIYAPDPEDDDEFTPSKSFLTRARNKAQKLTRSSSCQNTDEDSQERQVINFNPNADMNEDSTRESSIRSLFGKDEACYVMDAKITGNLGRYFNHSCSPNLFVQNVFVDTHDLRFPWVAFFSSTNIRAGTELTWNYNYEVGVVPGKVLYCQCGAPNCRLRLL